MDEEYLAHYGVKGMKWGVRHDRRSSGSGSGRVSRALKRGFRTAGGAVKKGSSRVAGIIANKAKASIAKRKELKEVAKDAGYSTNVKGMREFNALRNKTLSSHDPATVAKGMHTLTDSELRKKMDRLKLESQVHDIVNDNNRKAYEQANRAEQLKKARNEARASGILGKAATNVLTTVGTHAGKEAVNLALEKIKNAPASGDSGPSDVFNYQDRSKTNRDWYIKSTAGIKGNTAVSRTKDSDKPSYNKQATYDPSSVVGAKRIYSDRDKTYSARKEHLANKGSKATKKKLKDTKKK